VSHHQGHPYDATKGKDYRKEDEMPRLPSLFGQMHKGIADFEQGCLGIHAPSLQDGHVEAAQSQTETEQCVEKVNDIPSSPRIDQIDTKVPNGPEDGNALAKDTVVVVIHGRESQNDGSAIVKIVQRIPSMKLNSFPARIQIAGKPDCEWKVEGKERGLVVVCLPERR
jgi:hypothetical protein